MTEKRRRDISSSLIKQNESNEKLDENRYTNELMLLGSLEKDIADRELLLENNTEISGLLREYKFLFGKYHPHLEEELFEYTKPTYNEEGDLSGFERDKYYDCPKLRTAALLEEGNEFFTDLEAYPISEDIYPNEDLANRFLFPPFGFINKKPVFLTFTSGYISSGDINITLRGQTFTKNVSDSSLDTPEKYATYISSSTFEGWTSSVNGATIRFIKDDDTETGVSSFNGNGRVAGEIEDGDSVLNFEPTEENLYDMIIELETWHTTGKYLEGTGEEYSPEYYTDYFGDPREYIDFYGEYEEFFNDGRVEKFIDIDFYGAKELTNNFILIVSDNTNFAFGKVVKQEADGSKILFTPYCKNGVLSDGGKIYFYFEIGDDRIKDIMYEIFMNIKKIYNETISSIERSLIKNSSNDNEIINLNNHLEKLENIEDLTISELKSLAVEIFTTDNRSVEITDRSHYIYTYISSNTLKFTDMYNTRMKIIKSKINKKNGTLRTLMLNSEGLSKLYILVGKELEIDLNNYMIVKRSILSGDNTNRIFIDDADDFEINDEVYLISDNENMPQIRCYISHIEDGYLKDIENSGYDFEQLTFEQKFKSVKKLFFRDMTIRNKTWPKRNIPPTYSYEEYFRILKHIGANYLVYNGGVAIVDTGYLVYELYGGVASFENDPYLDRDFVAEFTLVSI